ncbi:mechanosensitive ion channel domain-containing protein [Aeoliella mucimassa]|uniref:mechanosensitive ion channel domain-containing protein n=1 Tax=Aeoliella mucimassa TaxID=2527972 RepID=UPI001E2B3112|nr:mechanosensitive ion channel domain-containing protein [Aeoliella mucimassa]
MAQDSEPINPLRAAETPAAQPAAAATDTNNAAAPPANGESAPQPTANGDAAAPANPPTEQAPAEVKKEFTKAEIEAMQSGLDAQAVPEEEKTEAKQYYQDAIQSTNELQLKREELRRFAADHLEKPDEKDPDGPKQYSKSWYERRLALPVEHPWVSEIEKFDVRTADQAYLEKRAAELEQRSNEWNKKLEKLTTDPSKYKAFLNSFPSTRQAVEERLSETQKELEELTANGGSSTISNAKRVALLQRQAKLTAELQALDAQRDAYQRALSVYDVELKYTQRLADAYDKRLKDVRGEINARRQRAANEQVQEAEAEANRYKALIERNPDSLGTLATNNQALAKDIQSLVEQDQQVIEETTSATKLQGEISTDFTEFKQQFGDDSQLAQASGELLRKQRERLPRPSQLQGEILKRTNQRNNISFVRFNATQERKNLSNRDQVVAEMLQKVRAEDRSAAAKVIRQLLESKAEYLESYIENLDELEVNLNALIAAQIRLKDTAQDFRDFIAERDLWIRSCGPLWASDVRLTHDANLKNWRPFYLDPTLEALAWSLSPENWLQVLNDLQLAASRQPFIALSLSVAFLLLLWVQRRSRVQLRELGEEAEKKTCTDFMLSLRALYLTVIVSLPWPLLLWGIGKLLEGPPVEADFSLALSQALQLTAWLLLLTEFTRQCCRANGLVEAHLDAQRSWLAQLRRYLRWMPIVAIPLAFWQIGLDAQTGESLRSDSLGRLLFLAILAYSTFVLYRLLLSHNSSLYQFVMRGTSNWIVNLHKIWRPLFVLVPIVLAVMATLGYYYTAEQLAQRMLGTLAMLLLLLIAGGLLRRWVLLNRRLLAREQAMKRRAQLLAAATEGDEVASIAEIVEETVDLSALSQQTRKLLRVMLFVIGVVGVIMIWRDVFTALAWLDENALPWSRGEHPTTWGDLLRSLLAALVTYVAVRDLPSLLELVILQHLPIDSGVRYATATLARYSLLAIGIVVSAAALGIDGTSISWLVAAMGVGLGFGLQEIFANFVSGIILLFERPIRVGDIITLGDKTGIVSRIRIRATTITDWDRKEYVVPNKDLVTERLLNWTLSDQINRVVIEVGIAYGSDTDQACDLLRQIVKEHPIVLDDPAPLINFDGFGDSTLNLIVRCYLPNLDNRLQTIHELHTIINRRFNEAEIEIAFPQRDLHIRSMPPNWESPEKLRNPARGNSSESGDSAETSGSNNE